MLTLAALQQRIKNSRLIFHSRSGRERLYFSYKRYYNGKELSTWFEVVNDKITPSASIYKGSQKECLEVLEEIYKQFMPVITETELERKKVPLHVRLEDDVTPIYDERSAEHQVDALRFLCSMKVSALQGDVGTMKSKILIDLCCSRYLQGQIKKVLVFLPVATKENFREQVNLWSSCPGIWWKMIGLETMGSSQRAVFEALRFVDNQTQIIIDESHLLKNPRAKRSKRIKTVCDKASYKVTSTGTPITENVHNIYMQYALLSDKIIDEPNWLRFEQKYLLIGGFSGTEVIGYKNLDHLLSLIEPYTHQIDKAVLSLKPARTFNRYCSLSQEQEEMYQCVKEELLETMATSELRATDIFQAYSKMQRIASGSYVTKSGKELNLGCYKLSLIKDLELKGKTVFFCKYIFEIDAIMNYLGRDKCVEFSGRNRKTRDAEKKLFCEGDKQYFVATMQTGGTGLNGLQFVSHDVVFYSNSFSYNMKKQSIGRLDRKGQTHTVNVYNLLTEAPIDRRILNCLSRKQDVSDEIKEMLADKMKLRKYIEEL